MKRLEEEKEKEKASKPKMSLMIATEDDDTVPSANVQGRVSVRHSVRHSTKNKTYKFGGGGRPSNAVMNDFDARLGAYVEEPEDKLRKKASGAVLSGSDKDEYDNESDNEYDNEEDPI